MVKSILKIGDLTTEEIKGILNDAKSFSSSYKGWQLTQKRLIANLFFEPSTRTHYSFLSAEHQLNCIVDDFNADNSSLNKGESLYDTIKTFEALGYDALVIRHPQDNYFLELQGISIPIINAGDGKGNHPSQCLLDLYTIYDEFGKFKDLNILIAGDIKHSRVAHSDFEALNRLGANVKFSGPNFFMEKKENYIDFDEGIEWADVVMMLRIQFERHEEKIDLTKEEYLEKYGLTIERERRMKKSAIIMHPAPVNRGMEIDTSLVESPKSRIFKQMENGVLVRKAMLKHVFCEEFEK